MSKGLAELWSRSATAKIDEKLHKRLLTRLEILDSARAPEEMNVPGYKFHMLHGHKPTRYSVHINGPWCVTFEFEDGDAYHVDFEQYH